MNEHSISAVLNDLWDPVTQCLTPEVARSIAELQASERVQKKLDELAKKSSEGTLTDAERIEYETYVRSINLIGVLQAKARAVIAVNPSSCST